MKRFLLLFAAISLILTACSDLLENEDKGSNTDSQIELSQNSVDINYEAGSHSVTVTSPYSWRASSHDNWITVDTATGIAGTKVLEFSVTRNEGLKVREGTIVIKNEDYNLVKELYVVQEASSPNITINTTQLHFSADGGSQEVVVTANCEYEVSKSADWLSIERIDNRIKVTAEKSYATNLRSAEIVISNNMYNISEIVKVEQETRWNKEGSIVGEWKLATWGDESESSILVYIAFNKDGSFDLYQRFTSFRWTHYCGTYVLNGSYLAGVYSDGVAWADEYEVLFSEDAICLIRKSDNNDISIYTKAEIPNHIIEESQNLQESRSVSKRRLL